MPLYQSNRHGVQIYLSIFDEASLKENVYGIYAGLRANSRVFGWEDLRVLPVLNQSAADYISCNHSYFANHNYNHSYFHLDHNFKQAYDSIPYLEHELLNLETNFM